MNTSEILELATTFMFGALFLGIFTHWIVGTLTIAVMGAIIVARILYGSKS